MGENLPNDKLEQFLKDSLGNYQEHPPNSVWQNIEADLPPAGAFWTFKSLFWLAGSIAATCLILLAYQYFYFKNQIDQLEVKIQQRQQAEVLIPIDSIHTSATTALTEFDKTSITTEDSQEQQNSISENSPLSIEKQQQSAQENNVRSSKQSDQKAPSVAKVKPPIIRPERSDNKDFFESKISETTSTETVEKKERNAVPDVVYQEQIVTNLDRISSNSLSNLPPITQQELVAPLSVAVPFSAKPNAYITKPLRQSSFFVELTGMLAQTKSFVNVKYLPDFQPSNKELKSNHTQESHTNTLGVNIGMTLSPRISLISGIWNNNSTLDDQHTLGLKKKERIGHDQLPAGDERLDYNYILNSSGGRIDVFLSLMQNNPDIPLTDETSFQVEVTTQQKVNRLSIPLLLEYKWGNGRLKPIIRGGLIAQFVTASEFKVENILSVNEELQFGFNPSMRSNGEVRYLADSYMDVSFSMGLAYELAPKIQLQLMPTFSTNITDMNEHPVVSGNAEHFGLTGNIRYNF